MMSCAWSSLDSPSEASRPSFHGCDELNRPSFAPRRLVRKSSKLHTTVEVTRCRFGSRSRQAAPIGCEDFIPQKDWAPISHAVYHDREAALFHFLHTGVSPDLIEGLGVPLLCIATACGHFEIAEILLKAGANVDSASKDKGETALHVAIRTGRQDIIDLLLAHQVNLESRTSDTGQTALHYAAASPSSLALVTKLLKSGAKYDVKDWQSQTPAVLALQAHNLQAAVAIINMARGNPQELVKDKKLLMQHMEKTKGRIPITNDIIADAFTATCEPDSTVLIEVIKKNDAVLVEMFLKEGADPQQATTKGLLPIVVAVKFASLRIIKLLVQHGADITIRGPGHLDLLQILFKTFTARDEEAVVAIVEYLFAKGADGMVLYPDGKTLLHRAVGARADHAKVAKLLIKNGIEVTAQDSDGNTALHLAASNGLFNTTRLLLDHQTDITAVDSTKRTALLRAIENQQWHVVPLLAVHPALTLWDAEGSTALHRIARSTPKDHTSWGNIATAARPFCERGICRSMRDRSGATPLIQAVKSLPEDGLPVVEGLLIDGDKKWNCVGHEDHKRHNALYYAATLGKPVFVQALLEHGASFDLQDWTSGQRQFKLPAASRERILDLLAKNDHSRNVRQTDRIHEHIPGTRIEIVRSELRTSSALSDYHADCETDRKAKVNGSSAKMSLSTRYLQFPISQRKLATPSTTFPARTTSIQQQSKKPTVQYRTPVQHTHSRVFSSSAFSESVLVNTKTVRFTKEADHHTEAIGRRSTEQGLQEATAAFPPRTSSRQQVTALPTAGTSRLDAKVHAERTTGLRKEPVQNTTPSSKGSEVFGILETHNKEMQSLSRPPEAPIESKPTPTLVATSDQSTIVTSENYLGSTTTCPEKTRVPAATLSELSTPDKSSSVAITPASIEPIQATRIDSGVSLTQNGGTANTLSALEQPQSFRNSNASKSKRRSGDELASWLAISDMLDRL